MPYLNKLTAAPALIAALSLTIAPATAADLPLPATAPAHSDAVPAFDIEASQIAEHRRYHRYRYRRGPGLGDVLAGVLIVGAIAHVAKAATRDDDRRYRDRDDRRDVRWDDEGGIDRAVQMCVDAVERERRVETVGRVDRTARGWMVEGTISRGEGFTCRIGDNGRIEAIDYGTRGVRYDDDHGDDGREYDDPEYGDREYGDRYEDSDYRSDDDDRRDDDDRQWDDDRYASEWSRADREAADSSGYAQPSYPGDGGDADEQTEDDLEIGTGYPGAGA